MDIEDFKINFNRDFKLNLEYKKCLCGSSLGKKLFRYDRYLLKISVVICKNCGLIFCNPMLKKPFIENFYRSDFYRILYNDLSLGEIKEDIFVGEPLENSSNAHALLKKYLLNANNLNILEVGCGNSANLIHFRKTNQLFATDFSNESKKNALRMGISFKQGGVDQIKKFNIKKFDIVILSHVIEHFIDFDNSILEIKKFTDENTLFYIEVPSMDLKYNLDQIQIAHNYYFTKNTFLFHLKRLGLISLEQGEVNIINQYGIFKNAKTSPYTQNIDEYKRIIKVHRNFFYNFYWSYLLNLYLRKFIKKLIGKSITTFIRNILEKSRK